MHENPQKHYQFVNLLHCLSTVNTESSTKRLAQACLVGFPGLLQASTNIVVLADVAIRAGDALREAPEMQLPDLLTAAKAATEAAVCKR